MVHGYEIRDFPFPLALSYFILQISSEKSTQWFSALSVKEFVHFLKKPNLNLMSLFQAAQVGIHFLCFFHNHPVRDASL